MNKAKELKTTTDLVKHILETVPETRNSDTLLYYRVCETIEIVLKKAVDIFCWIIAFIIFIVIAIITFPIWFIPFIYWYFTEWKGEAEDGRC